MKYFYLLFILLIISCKPSAEELTAQEIINQSLKLSGAEKLKNSEISFQFRNIKYTANRHSNNFVLTRSFDSVTDVLNNKGFNRYIDNLPINITDLNASKYGNSVNSVHYFSVLPLGLNDKAVQKKQLKSVIVKGKEYYKIEVTFLESGGGEDFEDVFVYWIGKEDFLIDYLAYSYHINGGGKRFRAVKQENIKNGIRFVDYDNYEPKNKSIAVTDLDKAFEENQLKKISEIILENIEVKILD
jgi:hypothetical protein